MFSKAVASIRPKRAKYLRHGWFGGCARNPWRQNPPALRKFEKLKNLFDFNILI
jgi:hypothetical protein